MKRILISCFVIGTLLIQGCTDESTVEESPELATSDEINDDLSLDEGPQIDEENIVIIESDPIQLSGDYEVTIEDVSTVSEETSARVLGRRNVRRILKGHNDAREEVGVAPLVWSEEVAESARRWARQLATEHPGQLLHSPRSDRNGYGENLSMGYAFGTSGTVMTPEYAVQLWTDEKEDYDYDSNSCASGAICGHYTQVVWENSTEVGCATARYTYNGRRYQVWVCQYNPAGNYIGQRPY